VPFCPMVPLVSRRPFFPCNIGGRCLAAQGSMDTPDSAPARPELLAIAGTGQNGATLLCRMLGELPGFVGVGEIGRLWDTGLIEDRECSCGLPFHECPFWTEVGDAGFGGWGNVDGYEVSRLREAVRLRRPLRSLPRTSIAEIHALSARHLLPFRLAARLSSEYRSNLRRYAELMGRLYVAIAQVAGASVVVDSMKFPYHVHMLPRVPGIDLRFVHLVRDSRGVAHSQTKTVQKQGTAGRYRRRRHPFKTALRWDLVNVTIHSLTRAGTPSTLVRYEDMVSAPVETLRRIAGFAGAPVGSDDISFVRGIEVDLSSGHLSAGNRMRMEAGPIKLRDPDGWKTELPVKQRRLVSLLTWPLIRRYHYVGPGSRTGSA
jgi:Sulfotransferase family